MTVLDSGHAHAGHVHPEGPVAAWVDGRPITVREVSRREEALRAGEFAARLPVRPSPQGRNVVRWIVQLMATEHIVRAEAQARGLGDRGAGGRSGRVLDVTAALELGGVLATVLASMPEADDVRDAVTAHVAVAPAAVRAYYEDNPDLFTAPESRLVDIDRAGAEPRRSWLLAGELPREWELLVCAARPGTTVLLRDGLAMTVRDIRPAVRAPFEQVEATLAGEVRERARDRFFVDWVAGRQRSVVRLATGYEHPGDPHHADATHRH